MVYKSNADPVVIEHNTVQPVIERNTIIERESSWYSEPWGVALVIALIAVVGIVIYFVGFNPSNSAPVVSNTTTRIEKDVTVPSASGSSAPVIVNNPPASSPTVNVTPSAPSSPSTVINNAPAVTPDTTKGSTSSSDDAGTAKSNTPGSDSNSADSNSTTPGSGSTPPSSASGQG